MLFCKDNHDKQCDNPALLVDKTQSIISVRLDYLVTPPPKRSVPDNERPNSAIIARYARGRDYRQNHARVGLKPCQTDSRQTDHRLSAICQRLCISSL